MLGLDSDDPALAWITKNFTAEGAFLTKYKLKLHDDEDQIVGIRIARTMAADEAASYPLTQYWLPEEHQYIARYWRHHVHFMQAHNLCPWNRYDCEKAVKLAKQLRLEQENRDDPVGNDLAWFDKMLKAKTRLSWRELLLHGRSWKSIYTYLPEDLALERKLTSLRQALHIEYDGTGLHDYPNTKFWEDKLLDSPMGCTFREFLDGRKVLKTEFEVTWGEMLLYGADALRGVMDTLDRVVANKALGIIMNDIDEDGAI
ncbi:uncharacterized protein RCC_11497 [Ramularia collo-cygni]|uniref:Uncharacterized protein n=1 Tax=Ramularia collo-cygni TaxID=112498 RepID=A0A2D3VCB0_9PEZI|nr:uncharacterized protein RCC_11497 [Ramularia collo-cygni]CZT25828.1 uncharacterized protein RCC_11497 [Ramularia collo-cygni]